MRLLFGVYGMSDEEAEIFVNTFHDKGLDISDYAIKRSKAGITEYLDEFPETDIVIFSQSIETKNPFTERDIERIVDKYENVRLIPILDPDAIGTDFVRELFNMGIFNAIASADSTPTTMVNLMTVGRSRSEARLYYKLRDMGNSGVSSGTANINRCVRYIESADGDFEERVFHVFNQLSPAELDVVISKLPDEAKEKIKNMPSLHTFYKNDEDDGEEVEEESEPKDKGGFFSKLPSRADVAGLKNVFSKVVGKSPFIRNDDSDDDYEEEKEDRDEDLTKNSPRTAAELKDILSNVLIGVIGTQKRAGTTHQSIIIANYLASYGYKVALVDCSETSGKSFFAIRKYLDVRDMGEYFEYNKVFYYPDVGIDKLNGVFRSQRYNFVVIDYGIFNQKRRADIGRCVLRFAVGGIMPWEIGGLNSIIKEMQGEQGDFYFLLRGMYAGIREEMPYLRDFNWEKNYIDIDTQNNPFSGKCCPQLAKLFEKYTDGMVTIDNDIEVGTESQLKRKELEKTKVASSKFRNIGTATYFVSSLKHGCGCTHFAVTVANVLNRKDKGSVCIVSNNMTMSYSVDAEVHICEPGESYSEVVSKYDFIVFDGGVYDEMEPEMMDEYVRASEKYMMGWADDGYLKELALFIQNKELKNDEFVFVFNNVPNGRVHEIKKLMNTYISTYLPLYDAQDYKNNIKHLIEGIL